jgi:SET domain-containing protein
LLSSPFDARPILPQDAALCCAPFADSRPWRVCTPHDPQRQSHHRIPRRADLVDEAERRPDSDPTNPYHTFLFELHDGRVIDAGVRGNAARWINHSCAPNCVPIEDDDARVYIEAKRTIRAGEELSYDYQLSVAGRVTEKMKRGYACRCGAPRCRGTMLEKKKTRSR